MATIQPVPSSGDSSEGVKVFTWSPVNTGDVCAPVRLGRYNVTSIQFVGTPTGASVTGSNDGTNFITLSDWQGNAISGVNAAAMKTPRDMPVWVQPVVPTGTGISVVMSCHRTDAGVVG